MRSQFTRSPYNRQADQRLIRGNFGLDPGLAGRVAAKPLAEHLDSVSSPGWPGISVSPLSRSAAAFLIHAAALRAVPGEGKDRRGCTARVQPARHGSRSVLCGLGGIAAEVSVG